MNGPQNNHLCSREISNADNPDPEMVVPSSALLDPWGDSYSGESRKMVEEQEERELNQIQRRQGQRFGGSLSFDLEIQCLISIFVHFLCDLDIRSEIILLKFI